MRAHIFLSLMLLLSVSILSASSQSIYTLFKHPSSSVAKCIDGSPAALYISQGQTDKILIYFQGGGMCYGLTLASTLQNCYNRSKTDFGSSAKYHQTKDLDDFTVMSNDEDVNPLYSTWTKIYIPYCDGVLHQGTKLNPIDFKGTQLYLRGMNNTLEHFKYLNAKYSLYSANKIVLAGTSAGAMAALVWANTLHKQITHKDALYVIFDSGQFVSDYLNPWTNSTPGVDNYKPIRSIAFVESQPPLEECLQIETLENCNKFGVFVNYVIPPVFAIQSSYDLYAIKTILLLACPLRSFPASLQNCNKTEMAVIQDYRSKSLDAFRNLTANAKNGLWAISCVQHGFLYSQVLYNSEYYLVPKSNGKTILQALTGFIKKSGKNTNIDEANWPQNSACNGIINLKYVLHE